MTHHHPARYLRNASCSTQHRVHPSKELNMKANAYNVYDEGRASDVPRLTAVGAVGKSMHRKAKASTKAGSAKWLVAGLLLLSAIPMAAGAFRLTELTGGA